jgi:four helix bundle protein
LEIQKNGFQILDFKFGNPENLDESGFESSGGVMNEEEMKKRTRQFALRVMRLVEALPNSAAGRAIGGQLIRSGTSIGANYRAACRGRSRPDLISKLGIALEEADESGYWLELVIEGGLLKEDLVQPLYQEAHELTAILTKSLNTAKSRTSSENLKPRTPSEKASSENLNPATSSEKAPSENLKSKI